MSNPRVYGSVVIDGLRHEASGRIDGAFARTKGGWDTNTQCGKYVSIAVDADLDLVVTCLRCIGRRRSTGSILRGKTMNATYIDEVQEFNRSQIEALVSMNLPPGVDIAEIDVVGGDVRVVCRVPAPPIQVIGVTITLDPAKTP